MTYTGVVFSLKSGFNKIVLTEELILVLNRVSQKQCLHQVYLDSVSFSFQETSVCSVNIHTGKETDAGPQARIHLLLSNLHMRTHVCLGKNGKQKGKPYLDSYKNYSTSNLTHIITGPSNFSFCLCLEHQYFHRCFSEVNIFLGELFNSEPICVSFKKSVILP